MQGDLAAWVAQAGDAQEYAVANPQEGPGRQRVEVDTLRRDVFAKVAGFHIEAICREFAE